MPFQKALASGNIRPKSYEFGPITVCTIGNASIKDKTWYFSHQTKTVWKSLFQPMKERSNSKSKTIMKRSYSLTIATRNPFHITRQIKYTACSAWFICRLYSALYMYCIHAVRFTCIHVELRFTFGLYKATEWQAPYATRSFLPQSTLNGVLLQPTLTYARRQLQLPRGSLPSAIL